MPDNNHKSIEDFVKQFGDVPTYNDVEMYICPLYTPLVQKDNKNMKKIILPYGVCSYDSRVVKYDNNVYEECESYLKWKKESG